MRLQPLPGPVRLPRLAVEPVWHFKAGQEDRSHVTHRIQRAGCELDLSTDKRGRPYTLICTKSQASYERRVRQRDRDLQHRARLAR